MSGKQWIVTIYLMVIALTLGMVLVLGIIVAPVIFGSEALLPQVLLDRYHEGIIMSEIFRRFAFWGYVVSAMVLAFEINEYRRFRRDRFASMAALTVVGTLMLFSSVYVPKILMLQAQGKEATMSEAFASLHGASELDFKLLAVALIVLFIRRMHLMFVPRSQ